MLATGYLMRVFYGASFCGVEVSGWLYLAILAGAFYLGLGKRRGELSALGRVGLGTEDSLTRTDFPNVQAGSPAPASLHATSALGASGSSSAKELLASLVIATPASSSASDVPSRSSEPGRGSLRGYSYEFLTGNMYVCSGLSIAFYALWALESGLRLATVPLAMLTMMRYSMDVESGGDGDPMTVALSDRTLLVLGACWAASAVLSATIGA